MRSYSARSRTDDDEDDRKPPAVHSRGRRPCQQKPPVPPSVERQRQEDHIGEKEELCPTSRPSSRSTGVNEDKEKQEAQVKKIAGAVSLPGAVAVAGPCPSDAGATQDVDAGLSEVAGQTKEASSFRNRVARDDVAAVATSSSNDPFVDAKHCHDHPRQLVQHIEGPHLAPVREVANSSSEQQQQTFETSDLLVAAEIAPTEADVEARVAAQVEKRIMSQAPRADVVMLENDAEEEAPKSPRCRRWLLLLGLLALAAGAIAITAVLVINNNDDNEPKIPTPAPPDSNTKYTMFQVDWNAVKSSDGLCEDPTFGVDVSCGAGGTIELWSISDFANCIIVGESEISCTSAIGEDDWHRVLCACRGSSPSACGTSAQAVPGPSVSCSDGGIAGTRITIALLCPGQDLDYTQVQCDPTDTMDTPEIGVKTCLTDKQCLQDTCHLSLPPITASIPESAFTESCLYGV